MSQSDESAAPRRRARVALGITLFVIAFTTLYVMDGSRQPPSGDGWRLIGMQRGLGDPGAIDPLLDSSAVQAAFALLHLASPPPTAHGSPAFLLTGVGTIGCPARFDGVRFDAAARVVTATIAVRLVFDCDPSRVPESFIVAIDRERLPSGQFRFRLEDSLSGRTTEIAVALP